MNKRKRLTALLLCLVMAFGALACANGAEAPAQSAAPTQDQAPVETQAPREAFAAGVYTAQAQGNNGPVSVSVTFTGTEIASVEVTGHSETPGISDGALETVPGAIVSGQTLAVETVTGATNTSRAILAAVEECVVQAGGDVQALKTAQNTQDGGGIIEKTADVVVVGGGGAGLAAAVAAAQQGARVILVEKTGVMGGNTVMSGAGLNTADPELQKNIEMGDAARKQLESYLELNPADFGDFAPEVETLKGQIQEYFDSGEAHLFDSPELHMVQSYMGSKRTDLDGNVIVPDHELLKTLCSETLSACEWMKTLGLSFKDTLSTAVGALWQRTHDVEGGASRLIETMVQSAGDNGVEILKMTAAYEILMEDGAAVGVRAKGMDGELVIRANRGVVLATGGFASNAGMVKEYNNYWKDLPAGMPCDGSVGCTGDGIVMAQAVGAGVVGMGFIQILPICTIDGQAIRGTQNKIYVNKEGMRFVNENEARDNLVSAILSQTESRMYAIGDITQYELQGEEKLAGLMEKGYACMADTLEELAQQMEEVFGVDGEVFLETVSNYNSYVDAQEDPEFGRYNFIGKIDTAPFIAIMEAPALHHTMGGVAINADTQVLTPGGAAIPGLYAAGEVTGGIHAGNRLGGNAIADCMVFGRRAGLMAAE